MVNINYIRSNIISMDEDRTYYEIYIYTKHISNNIDVNPVIKIPPIKIEKTSRNIRIIK